MKTVKIWIMVDTEEQIEDEMMDEEMIFENK